MTRATRSIQPLGINASCHGAPIALWRVMALIKLRVLAVSSILFAVGCAPEWEAAVVSADLGDDEALVGVDEDRPSGISFAGTFTIGQQVRVCGATGLNQRSGAGTSHSVLRVLPEGTTVRVTERDGGWYRNDWSGRVGWSFGEYFCAVAGGDSGGDPGGDSGGDPGDEADTDGGGGSGFDVSGVSRDNIISISRASVGYSYWWGGGRLDGPGRGACYGSCPDCDHSGGWGADCSGFVAKAWLLPEALPMNENKHPFSTSSFYSGSTHWSGVARSNALRGDAMVYRNSGRGHMVIYEKDDPWGQMWTFEARGCSYGIVHNVRTLGSAYKAIRRDGL